MSNWVNITGCLKIETYKEVKDITKYVRRIMSDAPRITGSEADADLFINGLNGHNVSVNMDCDHCCYGDSIIYGNDGGFTCCAPTDFRCPEGEFQTQAVIAIQGDLRDREIEQTVREYEEFAKFIDSKGFTIDEQIVQIIDRGSGATKLFCTELI